MVRRGGVAVPYAIGTCSPVADGDMVWRCERIVGVSLEAARMAGAEDNAALKVLLVLMLKATCDGPTFDPARLLDYV